MMSWIKGYCIYLAWLIACVGFSLSIFYAEITGNEPCALCWYQRIALFPLVLILGVAIYRGDRTVIPYALPLVVIGGGIGIFQLLQHYFPSLQMAGVCQDGIHCSNAWVQIFGMVAFPWISVLGFIAMFILLAFSIRPE